MMSNAPGSNSDTEVGLHQWLARTMEPWLKLGSDRDEVQHSLQKMFDLDLKFEYESKVSDQKI